MTDKHYTHLVDMIAETEAEIAKILNQRDTAQDGLKQIEKKAPMLQTKIQYLTSAKTHYESILTGMGETIADEVTAKVAEVAEVEVVEKPKKKSLFKRLKKDPEPEEQPIPEQTPSKSASENLEDAIKDL